MSKLTGKVAIVTGASKGIGAGIAKGLGAAGAAVVVNYASSKEDAERVVAEITRKGGQALALAEELSMRPLQAHCPLSLGTLYVRQASGNRPAPSFLRLSSCTVTWT